MRICLLAEHGVGLGVNRPREQHQECEGEIVRFAVGKLGTPGSSMDRLMLVGKLPSGHVQRLGLVRD
jgi:hypothetical protein